jgi:hypothetical protein
MAMEAAVRELVPDCLDYRNPAVSRVQTGMMEGLTTFDTSVLSFNTAQAQRGILALRNLHHGWDSYDAPPPNETAIRKALHILSLLDWTDLLIARILPSAEGGVGFCFIRGDRYADLECANDGEVFGIRYVGRQTPALIPTDATDASVESALQEIREHIRG